MRQCLAENGMPRNPRLLILCFFLRMTSAHPCTATAGDAQQPAADLVLLNGRIVTMESACPEARALAVRGTKIEAVGTDAQIRRSIGSATQVIDLGGRLAIPGFIESHAHFMGTGEALTRLDLRQARRWEDIVAQVAAAADRSRPGEWIVGRGWHQEKWEVKPSPNVEGFPIHDALSKVSPDNPVLLTHASGHAALANSKAMEMAGISSSTPDPPGGEILRDAQGDPIGVFRETASGLLGRALARAAARRTAAESEADARRQIQLATRECLSKGITTFHDAGASFRTIDLYRQLADSGELGIRLYVMINEDNRSLAQRASQYRLIGYGADHLTVRAVKRLIDGALGPRGAWLLQPYRDLPASTGLNTAPVSQIAETARIAIDTDLQLCTHAIGDRANREVLDLYENTFRSHPGKRDLRWRIEHAQHLNAADIPRFGALGIIAAMQGVHCTSDAPYVLARLGPRRAEEGAYVWQKLIQTGAIVSNGTDAPVEDVSPIDSYYATVSRKLQDKSVFYAGQRLSPMEALKTYTWNGAYAAFEENMKGSLAAGKLADITVLSKDILAVPEDEIPTAEVSYTIVGGKVLFKR